MRISLVAKVWFVVKISLIAWYSQAESQKIHEASSLDAKAVKLEATRLYFSYYVATSSSTAPPTTSQGHVTIVVRIHIEYSTVDSS